MAVESHFYLREKNENRVKGASVPTCLKRQASCVRGLARGNGPHPTAAPTPTGGHNAAVQTGADGSQNFPSKRDVRRERQRPLPKCPFPRVGSWLIS